MFAVVQPDAEHLPGNGRRIVRALEVIEVSGQPFTAVLPRYEYLHEAMQIGVRVARAELDGRIAERASLMWEAGFVPEVARLEGAGLREGKTASRALGYAQVLRFLAGECSQDDARADTVQATKRFARRQESWFRRDPRVIWLDAADARGGGADLLRQAMTTISACGSRKDTAQRTTS